MKYLSIDELTHFHFDDGILHKIKLHDGNMQWKLSGLIATKKNSQNCFDMDMYIDKAKIIFEQVNIESIFFPAYKVFDSNDVLIGSEEERIANPEEYDVIFKETIDSGCRIWDWQVISTVDEKTKKHIVWFHISSGAGEYELTLSFSKLIVQWNKYTEKAWYEKNR